MKQYLVPAVKLTLLCFFFFCGVYTILIWSIAQITPGKGEGQTVSANGRVVGYALEGQSFTEDHYFNGRPSAVNYNAAGSAGSNKGPSNPDYLQTVQQRIDSFELHNPGIPKKDIPADLVTASGSGLDPDISLQGALVQAKRIARVRRLPLDKVVALINSQTARSAMNGIEKVNVLQLNIALEKLK